MLQRTTFFAAVCTAIIALAMASSAVRGDETKPPRKLAFVVGVSKYEKDGLHDLNFAQKDAEDLAAELGRHGFTVTTVLGDKATREGLEGKLNAFFKDLKKLGKEDVVFMAFAGHGQQLMVSENDRQVETPFFCPFDCLKTDPTTLISLNWVMQRIKDDSGSSQNLLVVDACRSNPARGDRGIDGSTVTELPNKLSILFGSSSGTRSFESTKVQQGVLTHFLLQGLRGKAQSPGGDITWLTLASYVMQSVPAEVAGLLDDPKARQQPNLLGNLGKQPVLAHAEGLFLSGESDSERLAETQCMHRLDKARNMLASLEKEFNSGHYSGGKAVEGMENYEKADCAAMLAWDYACLGNDENVRHYLPLIDQQNSDRLQSKATFLGIKARILGQLSKHLPNVDIEKEAEALRSKADSESERQVIARGLLLGDNFGSEYSFDIQVRHLDTSLAKNDAFSFGCFGQILCDRRFMVGRFAKEEMRSRLKKLEEHVQDKTDRLILNALRDDTEAMAMLLRPQNDSSSEAAQNDWMTHKVYWVVPLAARGETAALRRLLDLESPKYIMTARWLAAETLVDGGHFRDARELLHAIDLSSPLKTSKYRTQQVVLALFGEARVFPLPEESGGMSAFLGFLPLCHACGRLDDEEFHKDLLAAKKLTGLMPDLCYIDGLLADVPVK